MGIDWFGEFEEVGRSLRLGMEAQGCATLVLCLNQLERRLPLFPVELIQKILLLLGQALAAQERKDYLQVADILEYEIAPLLQQKAC